jgi:ABC-type transporter Mla MlaB component
MAACARDPTTFHLDVRDLKPDAVAVDLLARLALVARRNGCALVLRRASVELRELIELAGLSEVLPADDHPRRGAHAPPKGFTPRSTEPRC